MANKQPIIIKKIKKVSAHGHHGGAWKLAYADFVTAMMAFFLLMWLLGMTDEKLRKGIAEYFENPYKASLLGGDSVGDRTSPVQGGGSDLASKDDGQIAQVQKTNTLEEENIDMEHLQDLLAKIETTIAEKSELQEFKDQIKVEITPEGLRILIIDNQNRPMFNLASAQAAPYVQTILRDLAPVINELPNKISINGHTDARPYIGNQTGYTNWELSSDRANAARRELIKGGVEEEKIMRVIGLASSTPYNVRDKLDPMNRRISIVVMTQKTEKALVQEMSPNMDAPDVPAETTSNNVNNVQGIPIIQPPQVPPTPSSPPH